jgi:hypothetical protein
MFNHFQVLEYYFTSDPVKFPGLLTKYICKHSVNCAGIFKQSMGARNRAEIGLSYRPARLHSLAELIPWNRFLGSLKVEKFGLCIIWYTVLY